MDLNAEMTVAMARLRVVELAARTYRDDPCPVHRRTWSRRWWPRNPRAGRAVSIPRPRRPPP